MILSPAGGTSEQTRSAAACVAVCLKCAHCSAYTQVAAQVQAVVVRFHHHCIS